MYSIRFEFFEECIGFTMMCIFFLSLHNFTIKNSAPIIIIKGGF